MKYSIWRPGAEDTAPWNERYESLNDATEALRVALGWSDILLGPGYSEGEGQAWRAYEDQAALGAGALEAPLVRRGPVPAPVLEP